jgi:hypothetical protein
MIDDEELAGLLVTHLDADRRRDPGFALRVLTALPPRRQPRRGRLALLLAAAVLGALLCLVLGVGRAVAATGSGPGGWSFLLAGAVLAALAATSAARVSDAAD